MKKTVFLLVFGFMSIICFSQIKDPVKWSFSAKKIDATTYEIHLTATIETGWHIYSQNTPTGGPIPTAIEFTKNPLITLQGAAKEVGKLEKRHEELFGVDVMQFSDKVDFVQTIKLKNKVKTSVMGTVEFMVCNDTECLPPARKQFSITL